MKIFRYTCFSPPLAILCSVVSFWMEQNAGCPVWLWNSAFTATTLGLLWNLYLDFIWFSIDHQNRNQNQNHKKWMEQHVGCPGKVWVSLGKCWVSSEKEFRVRAPTDGCPVWVSCWVSSELRSSESGLQSSTCTATTPGRLWNLYFHIFHFLLIFFWLFMCVFKTILNFAL